jgi:hypothetical protein
MLDTVLTKIAERFNDFLLPQSGGGNGELFRLTVGDISRHAQESDSSNANSIQNNIVLTLVNIEEETSLKNNYPIRQEDTALITQKPTLYLNLYLLFAANFDVYDEALKHLGYVLRFFQTTNKVVFTDTFGNTYNLLFTLHNIGFENMNNLWVVLGNRYMPSALYKVRLVFIQEAPPTKGDVITNVESEGNMN